MSTAQINVHTQEFLENPNAALGCPHGRIKHLEGLSGPEFVGYETVRDVFRDARVRPKTAQVYLDMGVSEDSVIMEFLRKGNFNMMSNENHARIRPIIIKGFRPARIRAAEGMIRTIATELVDEMIAKGSPADLVADFSHHLSIRTISGFIGVPPEDVHEFESATVELILLGTVPFAPVIPRLEAALTKIHGYVASLIARRRAERREDFISDLVTLQEEGDDLSEDELIWSIVFVLLAGHDTTRAQIASTARLLIESGSWEQGAGDEKLVAAAVSEALRLYPAAYRFPRLAQEPLTVEDVDFEPGDLFAVNLAAAGRDPEVFEDPDSFVPGRERTFDIGFGFGGHHCIGWALATAEITQSMLELTSRLTDVQLHSDVVYKTGGTIGGPERVEISFTPRTTGGVA